MYGVLKGGAFLSDIQVRSTSEVEDDIKKTSTARILVDILRAQVCRWLSRLVVSSALRGWQFQFVAFMYYLTFFQGAYVTYNTVRNFGHNS